MESPSGVSFPSMPSIGSLLTIIDALHDNVAIVGVDGAMLWVSPSFERTYGITGEQIIGRTTYDLETDRIFFPSVAALVIKTGQPVTVTEVNQNGMYHIVTGVPIPRDDGELGFVVSYSVDSRYLLQMHAEYENINALIGKAEVEIPAMPGFCCVSDAMRGIVETIGRLAKVDTSVLITGESGVGKNVLARLLHHLSDRSKGPLVEINCAGIPGALLESELFGYETGAFTGARAGGKPGRIELAHNGTLFLDEIGELPLELQAKLLQVIQEKRIVKLGGTRPVNIDFRLVTATNQDLRALVARKRFRSDLFFRLNVLPVDIPPLRDRPDDILPTAKFVLDDLNTKYATRKRLAPETESLFRGYSWPGNVRELWNVLEQMVVVTRGNVIGPDDLPRHMQHYQVAVPESGLPLRQALDDLEARMVREAYARHGTTVAVGKALGISQPSAARKISRYCHDK